MDLSYISYLDESLLFFITFTLPVMHIRRSNHAQKTGVATMFREFGDYDEDEKSLQDDLEERLIFQNSNIENRTVEDSPSPTHVSDTLRNAPLKENSPLITTVRELIQIRDRATFEIELDKFPHLRERPEYQHMHSICDKYFKALQYQNALFRNEITISFIAATLEAKPQIIHRWLVLDQKPRLLWLLDHERTRMAITECLHTLETKQIIPSDEILRAAEDSDFRRKLLPTQPPNTDSIKRLLSLRKDPSVSTNIFTTIPDLQTYQSALRAFPLIQEHPKFDTLHRQTKLYFLIRESYPLHSEIKLPISAIAQYVGVSELTIRSWRNKSSRPYLLAIIENRATNLRIHQERLEKLREIDKDLYSIEDIARRLSSNHFIFGDIIRDHSSFQNYQRDADRYFSILSLVEAGYHPHGLEIHFKLPDDTIGNILRYQHRPYLIRLATNIPDTPPAPGLRWLPTASDAKNLAARCIQVPSKITKFEQLSPILEKFPNLQNPDSFLKNKLTKFRPNEPVLKQWLHKFGPIQTLEEKILAFGYLIGATLSDGHIKMRSNINSYFKIALSTKYPWSQAFGNRVAYYYTSLGVPTSPGSDLPPQKGDPHGALQWYSCNSPILTWFDQAVLGFKPDETHKETPAKIEWIFNAPRSFQIKVLQGLFDGDGWANLPNRVIGIDSKQNQESIYLLLKRVGIKATKYDTEILRIETKVNIQNALKLPIFLSATGRFETTKRIVQMNNASGLVEPLCNRPLMRRILQLRDENSDLSPGRISVLIHQELGIIVGRNAISRLIGKREKALTIDEVKVKTYFSLLEQYLQEPKAVKQQLFHKVKEETGYSGSLRSMDHWLSGRIPFDVKLALSEGYQVSQKVLNDFPKLNQYLPKRLKEIS